MDLLKAKTGNGRQMFLKYLSIVIASFGIFFQVITAPILTEVQKYAALNFMVSVYILGYILFVVEKRGLR